MSIRQDRLVEAIGNEVNNHKTLADIGKVVGYSVSYSKSRLYQNVSKGKLAEKIKKAYNPDTLKAKILKAEQVFMKAEDYSNYARMLELQAKILGLTKEVNAGQQVMVNIDSTIAKLKQPNPIDVTTSSTTA